MLPTQVLSLETSSHSDANGASNLEYSGEDKFVPNI